MASKEDRQRLISLARRGLLEGETGLRYSLGELAKVGCQGPGVDYGLDFNERPYFRTAVWEATWKNHEAIIRLLLEKNATVDYADYQARTPLHEAAFYGYRNLVELFLEKGHPLDPMDKFGQTPLFRAAEAGRDEIVDLLVERKAKVNLIDADGTTAQHVASFNGQGVMSEWLLHQGAYMNRFNLKDCPPGTDQTGGGDEGQQGAAPVQSAAAPLAKGVEVGEAATATKTAAAPAASSASMGGRNPGARAADANSRAEYKDK